MDEGIREAMARAGKALARETGAVPVDFLSVEPAEWPDASMGWAEPGHSYAQVFTEGYAITARSADRLFECRVSGETVRCKEIKG